MNQTINTPSSRSSPSRPWRFRRYTFEFLSIFIAVISAFALNNWNEDRRDRHAEHELLSEIRNGLIKDKIDMAINVFGHQEGLKACNFWQSLINNESVVQDSMFFRMLNLHRDFISIQNRAGYESLKSKGLELIRNDSLRVQIITFYEYDFATLKTLEENYEEMQFHRNYFDTFSSILGPYMRFGDNGQFIGVTTPLRISDAERNILLLSLWKIRANRHFALGYYQEVEKKTDQLIAQIGMELAQHDE